MATKEGTFVISSSAKRKIGPKKAGTFTQQVVIITNTGRKKSNGTPCYESRTKHIIKN